MGGRRNGGNLQPSVPAPQAAHALGLHARHAQEVLRVRKVGRQLRELGMKLGLRCQSAIWSWLWTMECTPTAWP
jgi:hypothetical protein